MFEFLLYVIAAFIAGALTFLAPCTLPILPAYFAYAAGSQRKTVAINTLFFGLGLGLVFTLMGVAAGSIGKWILAYKRELVYILGTVLMVFGIMSIFGKSFKVFSFDVKTKKTPIGSLIFGSVFALTWSGCIGPVLGFMLVLAANTQTAGMGGILLFVYSLGLMLPLFLVSLWMDRLPKDGRVWRLLRGKLFEVTLFGKKRYFHSTNLLTGMLFIILGIFLILSIKYNLTYLFPSITEWVFGIEDRVVSILNIG